MKKPTRNGSDGEPRSGGFLQKNATLLASLVTVVLFVVVMVGAYVLLKPGDSAGLYNVRPTVPQPLRLTQQAELNNYGWVDKNGNVAHIPIQRAMQLIATQGMPTLAPFPTPQTTPTP